MKNSCFSGEVTAFPRDIDSKSIRVMKCPLEASVKKAKNLKEIDRLELNITQEVNGELGSLTGEDESRKKFHMLLQITGTSNIDISKFVIGNTISALSESDIKDKYNIMLQGLYEMNPADVIEGMLCSQILTLYSQGMSNLKKAEFASSPELAESYMRCSVKLLRLQQETIERLEKYRRKGQQSVHVEHVHVHPGSQAIVGTVNAGGGGNT